jgi:hypothetical protein
MLKATNIRSRVIKILKKFNEWHWTINATKIYRDFASKSPNPHQSDRQFSSLIYNSSNLGDDIQSIAQFKYFPSTLKRINPLNRENLNTEKKNSVILLNGWFTHRGENWPPSSTLSPIYIGFHASNPSVTDELHHAYFKQHEPIGCRDSFSVGKFEKIGVSSFVSYCPTLTLPMLSNFRTDEILVVDAHIPSPDPHITDTTQLLKSLIPASILSKARYLSHRIQERYSEFHGFKIWQAYQLLKQYARAKIVITNRLHCALPCLAFGTPVIFLNERIDIDERLVDYKHFLNAYSSVSEKVEIDWENPQSADICELKANIEKNILDKIVKTNIKSQ